MWLKGCDGKLEGRIQLAGLYLGYFWSIDGETRANDLGTPVLTNTKLN
jgi:hypothetical protein